MGDTEATSLLSLPPGCRFYPSEEQLLCHYLSTKNDAAGGADPAQSDGCDLIRELDLFRCDPFDLPDSSCYSYGHGGRKRHWFCYTVRVLKERRAKSGYWRRKGPARDVVGGRGGTAVLGRRTSFVFYMGNSRNSAVRTDWVLYQYAQLDHVKASFVLCRVFVRSRGGNKTSDHGLSSCAEESGCTVRHIGVQHDGFHTSTVRHIGIQHDGFRTPSMVKCQVLGDNSLPRKNEMPKYPVKQDCELDDLVQPNGQVPSSVLGGSTPILDDLTAEDLLCITEGDFIELDDIINDHPI